MCSILESGHPQAIVWGALSYSNAAVVDLSSLANEGIVNVSMVAIFGDLLCNHAALPQAG